MTRSFVELSSLAALHDRFLMENNIPKRLEVEGITKHLLEMIPELLDLRELFVNNLEFFTLFDDVADEYEDAEVINDEEEMAKRRKARVMARKAVEAKSCLICGQNRMLHRHHYDYDKPIDVFVLCLKDHFKLHKQIRSDGKSLYSREETVAYITDRRQFTQLAEKTITLELLTA